MDSTDPTDTTALPDTPSSHDDPPERGKPLTARNVVVTLCLVTAVISTGVAGYSAYRSHQSAQSVSESTDDSDPEDSPYYADPQDTDEPPNTGDLADDSNTEDSPTAYRPIPQDAEKVPDAEDVVGGSPVAPVGGSVGGAAGAALGAVARDCIEVNPDFNDDQRAAVSDQYGVRICTAEELEEEDRRLGELNSTPGQQSTPEAEEQP